MNYYEFLELFEQNLGFRSELRLSAIKKTEQIYIQLSHIYKCIENKLQEENLNHFK